MQVQRRRPIVWRRSFSRQKSNIRFPAIIYSRPCKKNETLWFGRPSLFVENKRDTGCGDFDTLKHYCNFAKRVGAYTAGINPLHHLFPTDRQRMSPYQPSDRRFLDPIYIHLDNMTFTSTSKYIDYEILWREKDKRLRALFAKAKRQPADNALTNHGIFEAIAQAYGTVDRRKWPQNLDSSTASASPLLPPRIKTRSSTTSSCNSSRCANWRPQRARGHRSMATSLWAWPRRR